MTDSPQTPKRLPPPPGCPTGRRWRVWRRGGRTPGSAMRRTPSTAPHTARRCTRSTPAPDGQRIAARRPRLLYTHTDCIARYQRMRGQGKSSIPWAGTTTACPPSAGCRTSTACAAIPRCPTTPISRRPMRRPRQAVPISRRNFVELCELLTETDEQAFEALWRQLGLSVDWSHTYQTIDVNARAASQRAFLRNLARGQALPGRGSDAVGHHVPHGGGAG